MGQLRPLAGIPEQFWQVMLAQAEREYPKECCGMVFVDENNPCQWRRIRPCQNVQDLYHAKDPHTFPRTAETAYFIDPKELLAIQKEAREACERLKIIYHSHIEAGAYFSEEDKRMAIYENEPVYSGVDYLVFSVRQAKVQEAALFSWRPEKKDFVCIEKTIQ